MLDKLNEVEESKKKMLAIRDVALRALSPIEIVKRRFDKVAPSQSSHTLGSKAAKKLGISIHKGEGNEFEVKTLREMEQKYEEARKAERSAFDMITVLNSAVNVKTWRRTEAMRYFVKRMVISLAYVLIFFLMSCTAPDFNLPYETQWSESVKLAVEDSGLSSVNDPTSFWLWMDTNLAGNASTEGLVKYYDGDSSYGMSSGVYFMELNAVFGSIRVSRTEFISQNCTMPGKVSDKTGKGTGVVECLESSSLPTSSIYLVSDAVNATAVIHEAMQEEWIKANTSTVTTSMNVYNPSLTLFGIVEVSLERLLSGGYVTSVSAKSYKVPALTEGSSVSLSGRFAPSRTFQTVCSLLLFAMVSYEVYETRRDRLGIGNVRKELKMADAVNICMLFMIVVGDFYVYSVCTSTLEGIPFGESLHEYNGKYFDVEWMRTLLRREREASALYLLLNIMMLVPIMRYVPSIGPTVVALTNTVLNGTVLTFLFITTLVYLLSSFGYSAAFGADVSEFSSPWTAFIALFRMPFVEEWGKMDAAQGWIYSLFWFFFIIISTVFVNLLIAIISDVYPSLRERSESEWETLITEHLERMMRKTVYGFDKMHKMTAFNEAVWKRRNRILKGLDGLKHWKTSTGSASESAADGSPETFLSNIDMKDPSSIAGAIEVLTRSLASLGMDESKKKAKEE